MAIYNIFDYDEKELGRMGEKFMNPDLHLHRREKVRSEDNYVKGPATTKDQIFSAICARFFFFVLLIANIAWGIYSFASFFVKLSLFILTFGKIPFLRKSLAKTWLNMKRSIVCGIALAVAVFSPALGIMFSCMYFLMYDKKGVEEIVPSSLRGQFQELYT